MKRFLIAVSLVLMAFTASADNSVDDVLKQIAQNNLTLRALQHDNEADVLDIKAENSLDGLSVEYSPFFRSGYSGVAESELVVSQEIQFPTKYAATNRRRCRSRWEARCMKRTVATYCSKRNSCVST